MAERLEEELMDDLYYEEAEGAAEMFDDVEEFEDCDDFEEDEFEDEDEWEGAEEDYFEDEFEEGEEFDEYDEYDEYDDYEAEEEEESEDAMAYALGAEDSDEFFGLIAKAVPLVARGIGSLIRRIRARRRARRARRARISGNRFDEGAIEEALEAFAELATKKPKARPIVAGLAARTLLKKKGARLPLLTRKKIVKDISKAIKILTRKKGKKAVRAIVPITKSVKRAAIAKQTPPKVTAKIVKRIATKVAKSPRLTKKLSKPILRAKAVVTR